MKKMRVLRERREAFADRRFGDLGVLKLEIFDVRLHPQAQKAMAGKQFSLENYDMSALASCPPGSLGQTYAEHMHRYGLKPFDISPRYMELAQQHSQGLRYIKTHDLFHVLTGFDTSLAGEIGVLYFTAAQKMYRFQSIAAVLALIGYPLVAPHKMRSIIHSARTGWRMGKKATHLLGFEFERHWNTPIDEVRRLTQIQI